MNHYTSSKAAIADLISMERSDRYASYKIDRTGDGTTGPTVVRELHAAGVPVIKIAQRFGVTEQAIRACIKGKTYASVR